MKRTFIEVPMFSDKWKALGLNDEDLRIFQNILLKDPKLGKVIPDTGGLRKIRIPVDNMGKRGGGRVVYVDVEVRECIYLIDVYAKHEKTDLTHVERKMLRKLVEVLKEG